MEKYFKFLEIITKTDRCSDESSPYPLSVKNLFPYSPIHLLPSKRVAFTKPSRGTSDSERRTIINGNRVFRFDCERCRLEDSEQRVNATAYSFNANCPKRGAAFTLAEVLITLGIIGVVAAMTLPSVIQKQQEKSIVTALQKFNSVLAQAILLYKAETGNTGFGTGIDSDNTAFEPIAQYMNVLKKCTTKSNQRCSSAEWLPFSMKNYYGEIIDEYGYSLVTKKTIDAVCYLLTDGISFCIDVDPDMFNITVDINNKKPPNRVGQDIFFFMIGSQKDVQPGKFHHSDISGEGLCKIQLHACNPNNTDPTKDGGAFPTAYVLLNHKLPPKYSR